MGFLHKKCCKTKQVPLRRILRRMHTCWTQCQDPRHVRLYERSSEDVYHAWARDWTKDSEPFVSDAADAADSGAVIPSAPSQSDLQRFMPLKDMAMSVTQQEEFHMLLLKGTVSGNLPFSSVDNEYIQAAFAIARPTAVLPGRRALSGLLCALLLFYLLKAM